MSNEKISELNSKTSVAGSDLLVIVDKAANPTQTKKVTFLALLLSIVAAIFGDTTGILKADGTGGISAASAGTDYCAAPSGSAIQKGNGSGGLTAANDGTDYLSPSTAAKITDNVQLEGEPTNITPTSLPNTNTVGLYRINYYLSCITQDAGASKDLTVEFIFNDLQGQRTITSAEIDLTVAGSTTQGVVFAQVADTSTIFYVTTASNYGTSAEYNLFVVAEKVLDMPSYS